MLPPLRSTSGSGSSFQNHSSLASGPHQATQAAYKVQVVDWKGDSNSSSAGKLNVLLLAGRERIADHLTMLADIVGKAINLPRREGEGSGDYILRLAEAVSRLGPRQRAEVERQLNLVVQGLKLRFLFEAFSNPAGPQAARIVAYMETARYKDRDLAARSVVTSYRQNSGGDGGTGAGNAAAPTASPPENAGAQKPPEPAQMAQDAEANAETGKETGVEANSIIPGGEDELAGTDDGIDARSLQALLRRAFDGGDNGDAAIEAKATAELLAVEDDRSTAAEAGDETQNFGEQELAGYETGDANPAQPRAPGTGRPLRAWGGEPPANPRQLAEGMTQAADRPQTSATLQTGAQAAGAASRAPSSAANTGFEPTLFTLKGWMETEVEAKDIAMAYEAIIEDGEEAQTLLRKAAADAENGGETTLEDGEPDAEALPGEQRLALARALLSKDAATLSRALPAQAQTGEAPGDEADSIYDPLSASGHTAEEAEETLAVRDAARPAEKPASQPVAPKPVPSAVIEQQALAQLLPVARDMVPVALAPVSLRDDEFPEETQLEGRPFQRDEEAEQDGGEQDGNRQEARDDADADAEQGIPAEQDGDAAYALYQRMANWT